jgi:hypothetical protein
MAGVEYSFLGVIPLLGKDEGLEFSKVADVGNGCYEETFRGQPISGVAKYCPRIEKMLQDVVEYDAIEVTWWQYAMGVFDRKVDDAV